MQTPTDILAITTNLVGKSAYKFGFPRQTILGPAYEAVLAAQKSWRPGGKSLESWAEGYLRATIRKERGHHKVYKGRAQYVSLDAEIHSEEGEGMNNHEIIGDWSGAEEIEEALKEREVAKPIKDMSPRLQVVADMRVNQGCSLTETGKRLGGYTPARIKQLQAKIAKGLRGVAAEGPQPQLGLVWQQPQEHKAHEKSPCFGSLRTAQRWGTKAKGAGASVQMSMF